MKKQNGASWFDCIISLVLILVVVAFSAAWRSYSCYSYGDLTGRDTKYTITNGCFIKHNDKFIPRSELERRFIMDNQEK